MMGIFDLIPRAVWAVLVAVLAATSCKFKWDNAGLTLEIEKGKVAVANVEKQHFAALAAADRAIARANLETRITEQELQKSMDIEREKNHASLKIATAERDALKLRFASFKMFAGHPTPTGAPSEATHLGEGLGGTDVTEFPDANKQHPDKPRASGKADPIGDIIDEAFRAETIRLSLISCYRSYDEARGGFGDVQK